MFQKDQKLTVISLWYVRYMCASGDKIHTSLQSLRCLTIHFRRCTVIFVALLLYHSGQAGGSSSSSSSSILSFCITDSAQSNIYYLADQTLPLPGQSLFHEEYTQGRLVLGGVYLPNPKIIVSSADGNSKATSDVLWNQSGLMRPAIYHETLFKICRSLHLASTTYLSVVPVGLSGTGVEEKSRDRANLLSGISSSSLHEGPSTDQGILSTMFARPQLPRLWSDDFLDTSCLNWERKRA
jgi:hypothetical protein